MSSGPVCECPERSKPLDQRNWVVIDYKCNFSAFSGYAYTPSDYSAVQCHSCGRTWRTKAAYVDQLDSGTLLGLS